MDVAQLIALAAKRALDAHPLAIGVRFSPISISAGDLKGVVAALRRSLGQGTFVAASAPGAQQHGEPRVLIAGSEEAAERATAWRNAVRVQEGERLIYLSVEEHGKASGLKDCLLAVPEADLVDLFLEWLDGDQSGVPAGVGLALREAGLHESRSLKVLTEFARLAAKGKGWAGVGKHLPALGLARDSGLKAADAADRLRANARLVSAALTGETRRRTARAQTAELEEGLYQALRGTPVGDRSARLADFDLGDVRTNTLGPKPKRRREGLPQPAAKARPKREPAGQGARPASKATPNAIADERPRRSAASPGGRDPTPARHAQPAEQDAKARPRLHAPPLPEGLSAMLSELHAGSGEPVQLVVAADARGCLATPPKVAERKPAPTPTWWKERVGDGFTRWAEARRALLTVVAERARQPADVEGLLVHSFLKLADDAQVRDAAARFLEAATALYRAVVDRESALQRAVLALDTVAIWDRAGIALRLLGPLHILWLSQAQVRHHLLAEHASASDFARRLLARSLGRAPSAPQTFPEEGRAELRLASPEAGVLVFERAPDAAVGEPVSELAERLIERYLDACPHALFGLRVAVLGGDETALLEGVARVVDRTPDLAYAGVLCGRPPRFERSSAAGRAVEAGRLRVGSVPAQAERLGDEKPHLVVHFHGGPERPDDEEPSPPAVATYAVPGAGASTFEVRQHGLRVWTALAGNPGALAFEAVHAAISGRKSVGAFVHDHSALSLKSALSAAAGPGVSWQVAVAPSIGRRPPLEYQLIAHDRVESAQFAVVARDLRPLSRDLQGALRQLGVNEARPSKLRALGDRLSSTTTPRISLRRSGTMQLLAGVLAIELARLAGKEGILVPIEAEALAALDEEDSPRAEVVMLSVWEADGGLSARVGIAVDDEGAHRANVGREAGGAARAAALSELWRLAAAGEGAAGGAARELLNWIVWPAMVAEDGGPRVVQRALTAWSLRPTTEPPLFLGPSPAKPTPPAQQRKKPSAIVANLNASFLDGLLLAQ
ncbi:MAG TPA: hypothetical protein VFS43_01490 [Polyangiaceae bacterium]|nr:hypothetical protein [Polyangiaceae bacterium]